MKRLSLAVGLALLIGSGSALASTHSDYTKCALDPRATGQDILMRG
jgi:hypothetical protein